MWYEACAWGKATDGIILWNRYVVWGVRMG